jgi:hypothetical protein
VENTVLRALRILCGMRCNLIGSDNIPSEVQKTCQVLPDHIFPHFPPPTSRVCSHKGLVHELHKDRQNVASTELAT